MLAPLPARTGPYRVLAISGSLRSGSSNALALQAARACAPPALVVTLHEGIGELPHFNPDHDMDADRPAPVRAWRAVIAAADALLISSPEYAHGVPGSLKNALDWLVSGPEFPALPVALVSTSAHATHAQAALAETVRTMSADLVPPVPWIVPLPRRALSLEEVLADPALMAPVRGVLAAVEAAIGAARVAGRRLVGPQG